MISSIAKSKTTRGDITLVTIPQTSYYQRDDGFFCLSDACRQLGKKPIDFLNEVEPALIFFSSQTKPFPSNKVTLSILLDSYPQLIQRERRAGTESGIWLHPNFTDCFERWAMQVISQKWYLFSPDVRDLQTVMDLPMFEYRFLVAKPLTTQRFLIRETDGFVNACDLYRQYPTKKIHFLLEERGFILALAEVTRRRNLKPNVVTDSNFSLSRRVYEQYSFLLNMTRARQQQIPHLWIDPEVYFVHGGSNIYLHKSLEDWHQRQQPDKFCRSTQLSLNSSPVPEQATGMLSYVSPSCSIVIYDFREFIGLKVTDTRYDWQFVLNLSNGEIGIDRDLLGFWGWTEAVDYDTSDVDCFMAEMELYRAKNATTAQGRILDNTVAVVSRKFEGLYWYFECDGEEYTVKVTDTFKQTVEHIIQVYRAQFGIEKYEIDELRLKLVDLGYTSPMLSQVAIADLLCWEVNGVTIRQRDDGKIDATALCRAYGKRINDWLKNNQVWDLFSARAKELSLNFNYDNNDFSVNKRVSEAFPALIERKSGSPSVGGGTWLDPKMFIFLSMWVDSEFAMVAGDVIGEWLTAQRQNGLMR